MTESLLLRDNMMPSVRLNASHVGMQRVFTVHNTRRDRNRRVALPEFPSSIGEPSRASGSL